MGGAGRAVCCGAGDVGGVCADDKWEGAATNASMDARTRTLIWVGSFFSSIRRLEIRGAGVLQFMLAAMVTARRRLFFSFSGQVRHCNRVSFARGYCKCLKIGDLCRKVVKTKDLALDFGGLHYFCSTVFRRPGSSAARVLAFHVCHLEQV